MERCPPLAKLVPIQARDAVGGVAEVLGRKGFDSDAVRAVVLEDLNALTMGLRNREHPRPWDGEMHRAAMRWNRIDRAFDKAWPVRRIAARAEMFKDVHFGMSGLISGPAHVRRLAESANTA